MPLTASLEPRPPSAEPPRPDQRRAHLRDQAGRFGYFAVIAFYLLYFFRPEDFIPGVAAIPLEKITGGLVALALLGALLANRFRAGREVKLMLVFLGLLCCSVPGSVWPGGSFHLVEDVAKSLLVVIATICVVDSLAKLRHILLIPTLAMLFMAVMSFTQGRHADRMFGVGKMFSDPNDFALYLLMIVPLCVYFGLTARSKLRKLFWVAAAALALVAVVATGSRGGFLALIATALAVLVSFRGKVRAAIIVLALGGIVTAAAMPNSYYMTRMATILRPSSDKTGSAEQREYLLDKSLQILLKHPLFGIGAGQFDVVSGVWHTSHNTYTEVAAEAGVPALAVLLALLWLWFSNSRRILASERREENRHLARALQCSLAGYLVGAFFLSTAYWLMPYLFVASSLIAWKFAGGGSRAGSEAALPAPAAAL